MNQIFKKQSVVFTGHRSVPKDKEQEVRQQVRGKIRLLFSLGFRKFVSGMALGFDMLAAEEVIRLKEELKGVKLVAVVPYRGQSGRWTPYQRERYQRILNEVDTETLQKLTMGTTRVFDGLYSSVGAQVDDVNDRTMLYLSMRFNRRIIQNALACKEDILSRRRLGNTQQANYRWMLIQPFMGRSISLNHIYHQYY